MAVAAADPNDAPPGSTAAVSDPRLDWQTAPVQRPDAGRWLSHSVDAV